MKRFSMVLCFIAATTLGACGDTINITNPPPINNNNNNNNNNGNDGDGNGGEDGGVTNDNSSTLTFTGSPLTINPGESSTLNWNCVNGNMLVRYGGWSGSSPMSGSEVVYPSQTTTYTLDCANPNWSVIMSVTITVNGNQGQAPNPTSSLVLYPTYCTTNSSTGIISSGTSDPVTFSVSGSSGVTLSNTTGTQTTVRAGTTLGNWTVTSTNSYGSGSTDVRVVDCGNTSTQVTVTPHSVECQVGTQTTFRAVVTNSNPNASKAVTWSVENNMGVGRIVSSDSTQALLACDKVGSLDVRARAVVNTSATDTGLLNVYTPVSTSCFPNIDYTSSRTVAVNQNTTATATYTGSWPSNCQIAWGTDKPSTLRVNGSDTTHEVCDENGDNCVWYYTGKHASITGIYPSNSSSPPSICARVIRIREDRKWVTTQAEKCYTWTVTPAPSSDVAPDNGGYYDEEGWVPNVKYDPSIQQEILPAHNLSF